MPSTIVFYMCSTKGTFSSYLKVLPQKTSAAADLTYASGFIFLKLLDLICDGWFSCPIFTGPEERILVHHTIVLVLVHNVQWKDKGAGLLGCWATK